ncbi:MAG TPA: glutamate racemase [Firmicutes bacterium]|nr:glutamate racemase [Bacillota bacterium]
MGDNKAIALFDSGVGGLTVVKEIFNQLPAEKIIYFGDTARFPYGPRPQKQVRGFVFEIMDFLQTQDIKTLIVACNSATAAGLEHYRERTDLPLLGVIEPGIRAALARTRNGKVGVIGTQGTIESGAYGAAFRRIAPDLKLYSQACPLFVLLVENDLAGTPEARQVARVYLSPLKDAGIDTLILGCTHYPLMADVIQGVMGPDVTLISSAEETARETREVMEKKQILNSSAVNGCRSRFFVSGPAGVFQELASKLLGESIRAYQIILNQQ